MQLASVAVFTAILAAAAPARAETDAPKSENTALALSLGGTLASAGLMASGFSLMSHDDETGARLMGVGLMSFAITPSLGHIYSGKILTGGLALRAGGAAVALVGVAQALDCGIIWSSKDCGFFTSGEAAVLLGGTLAAAGVIWDIASAPRAARRYNEKHISLVPAAPGASLGLSLAGRF
jgi:hypothetical protein